MFSYAPRISNPPLSVLISDETLFVVFYISVNKLTSTYLN